jgi:hypothetical protein
LIICDKFKQELSLFLCRMATILLKHVKIFRGNAIKNE